MLDESPGSRGGCWLKAEALSPRWGEQAVKWKVENELTESRFRHGQPELRDQATGARLEGDKDKMSHLEKGSLLAR